MASKAAEEYSLLGLEEGLGRDEVDRAASEGVGGLPGAQAFWHVAGRGRIRRVGRESRNGKWRSPNGSGMNAQCRIAGSRKRWTWASQAPCGAILARYQPNSSKQRPDPVFAPLQAIAPFQKGNICHWSFISFGTGALRLAKPPERPSVSVGC